MAPRKKFYLAGVRIPAWVWKRSRRMDPTDITRLHHDIQAGLGSFNVKNLLRRGGPGTLKHERKKGRVDLEIMRYD